MSTESQSTGDILRETIYRWLENEFIQINAALSPEMQTDLDGVLWKLSRTLSDAGMWKVLQDVVGLPDIREEQRAKMVPR